MPLEPESEPTRVARDLKVLMADDDPAQLMLSEAALAGAGFLVYTVVDGQEAIEEYARRDLGMIRPGETFYRLGDRPAGQP